MLSIIIPTLNEEKCLTLVLNSIKKQGFYDYEIIIADAGSKDGTLKIAESFGCRVVPGGLPGRGRNEGAKAAKGDLLLFSDADIIFPEDFLKLALDEFSNRSLGVAAFKKEPITDRISSRLFIFLFNLVEKIVPFGGMVILAKKELHGKLGGFDENIKLGEDTDYLWRAKKMRVFGIIKNTKYLLSLRRFEAQGYLKTVFTYFAAGLYMIIFGFPKSDIFKYKFDIYSKKSKKGFTLIELLTVTAIVGLLASLIMVNMGSSRDKARVSKTLEFSQTLYNVLGAETVGAWGFDEGSGSTARDVSGHGKDGNINAGATYTSDTPQGLVGLGSGKYALDFDGSSGLVNTTSDFNFTGYSEFTVAAWVKANDTAAKKVIYNNVGGFGFSLSASEQILVELRGTPGPAWYSLTGNTAALGGKWHYIVIVYKSGQSFIAYLDGKEDRANTQGAVYAHAGSVDDCIGKVCAAGGIGDGPFNGLIDEVSIYSRALTRGEVQKLYAEGLGKYIDLASNSEIPMFKAGL